MEFDASSTGVVVLVIAVVIDKVLSMLKSRGIDFQQLNRQVNDLHAWHSKEDEDGVKVWYVRRSLEDAISKLADNVELETRLLDRIDQRLEKIENSVGVSNH